MQLYIYDTLFVSFIKTLLLFLLPYVQETMCEVRRSADHPTKTEHFNFTRDNFLMSQKLNFLMLPKLSILMSQKLTFLTSQRSSFLMSQKRSNLLSEKVSFLMSQKFSLNKQFVAKSAF